MMTELHTINVGPASKFEMGFGSRLNIFTGDNGLGKTFLLDMIWRGLTDTWSGNIALPFRKNGQKAEIAYRIKTEDNNRKKAIVEKILEFRVSDQQWFKSPKQQIHLVRPKSIVMYIRVDGSFSVWDPARNPWQSDAQVLPAAYHFTPENLWSGLAEQNEVLCNGLLRDWVTWQYQPDQDETSPFNLLTNVLEQLAPSPGEWMKPGKPTRISLRDVRDIPTIDLPYGNVPVTHASAGMKRILGLAYLLVWTWYEHTQAAKLREQPQTDALVLLMDEVDAHLHPQWQRSLLTSLVTVAEHLKPQMSTQLIVTTHSPLVLASVEPFFDEEQDKLFLFELEQNRVTLHEDPWAKQGDAVGWLTSDIFGLKQARSKEAELAIDAANTFMRGEALDLFPKQLQTKEGIHQELQRVLAGHDPFWSRWIISTEEV